MEVSHRVSSDAGNAGKAGKQSFFESHAGEAGKNTTFSHATAGKLDIYFSSISFV